MLRLPKHIKSLSAAEYDEKYTDKDLHYDHYKISWMKTYPYDCIPMKIDKLSDFEVTDTEKGITVQHTSIIKDPYIMASYLNELPDDPDHYKYRDLRILCKSRHRNIVLEAMKFWFYIDKWIIILDMFDRETILTIIRNYKGGLCDIMIFAEWPRGCELHKLFMKHHPELMELPKFDESIVIDCRICYNR